MPYVPGFTNDIFISFSHADNWDGWVEKFQDHLRHRLRQIDAPATIWRDTELLGTDVFSDKIFAQLQQSALLISIVSPQGIRSRWCEDERQAFERFAALNGGFRLENTLRAIKVVKTPLPADQHRNLFGVIGYEFYERDAQSRHFHEFDLSSPEFRRILDSLAQDIKSVLDAFSDYLKAASQKETVYVSTTTSDLKHNRDAIVQQIEDWGYAVVPPDSDPPRRLASFEAVAKAELIASMFSVHLVSDHPQPIFEDRQDSITTQYELAQLLRKDRIVWVGPGRELYSEFDHTLKRSQNGLDILKDRAIEDLKEVIRDKLDQRWNQPAISHKSKTTVESHLIRDGTKHPSEASHRSQRPLTVSENGNPFLGLRSFDQKQAHLFFGRDKQIRDLITRLQQHRFLPIVGVSGSGKSSLVRAGLIPALTGSYLEPDALIWRIAIIRPGRNPMHELATTLCREFAVPEFNALFRTLHRSSAGLARVVRRHLRSGENLLVLVDQFEELFRYHEDADPMGETDDDAAFVKLLLAAAGESKHPLLGFDDLPVYVVTTMRSEYLGLCSRFRGLPEALNESQYLIPRLTREQQRDVIEGPVSIAGASIEPALIQRLLNDLGDNPDQLPALQHALMCTWEQSAEGRAQGKPISVADYETVGGMADALNRDASEVYRRLSINSVTEAITRRLFQRLVAPDNETRSPTSFSELVAVTAADEADLQEVIDEFEKRGFLTISDNRLPVVDITHESLIRGWRQLTIWVEEERESAEIYRRLAHQAAQHNKNKASLYIDPELQLTLNWCHETKPNEAWAARYDSGFAQAIEFLEQSRKERDDAFEQAEQQRRSELKRSGLRAFVLAILLLVGIGALFFAKIQRDAALAERDRSSRLLYDSNIYFASSAVASGQFELARERLDELLAASSNQLRGFEWFYLWGATHADQATLLGHSGFVRSVAFSSDGRTLASASDDNTVKLWDIVARKELATLAGHSGPVWSVALSPDGKTLASASDDNTVKLWDTVARKELATLSGHSAHVRSVAFSPDGKTLASASDDNTVKLWDAASRKELAILSGYSFSVLSVAFSPDGRTLATVGFDRTVKLWDIVARKELATFSGHSGFVRSVAFSPDGKTLASASDDNTVRLWDINTRKELATLSGYSGRVWSVVFSPDGKTLAFAGEDKTVKLWDTAARKELATLSGHAGYILSVAFSPDGRTLASASFDMTIKLWDTAARKELATLSGHLLFVKAVAFSPDSKTLASASFDMTIRLWDTVARKELATLYGHSEFVRSVAFSPDGKTLASGSDDNTVKLWDTVARKELATLSGHSHSVSSVAFSPDSKTLASASDDNTVKLWDTAARKELATLSGHSGRVWSVVFSPDGKILASAGEDNTVKLWDTAARKELATLSGHAGYIFSVAFSPDGTILASASVDNTVKLWDTAARKELATLSGHAVFVWSVAFSPDGKMLASASSDNTLKLWFAATEEEIEERRRLGY